jgi:hypothetical protein
MNEVMKKETNVPAAASPAQGGQVLKSDVVIPKLLLMQGLSEFVNDRKAQQGDMVRSTSAEKLGDPETPVRVIPLTIQNLWMVQEEIKGKYEFRGYEPRTPENENAEWEFMHNGARHKRTKVLNLFALLPKDLDAYAKEMKKFKETGELPDLDKVVLPVVIPFRNTSFKAGKEVVTLFAKAESVARQLGVAVPAYGSMIELGCHQEKNDKGAFFVFDTTPAGKTPAEYKEAAASWYATLTSGASVKVDDSDERETGDAGDVQF